MNARLPLIVTTGLFLLRMAVAIAHGEAHDQLAVPLAAWQNAFVWLVIVIAPTAAMMLAWIRPGAAVAWSLACLLVAGWLFGLYFHFGPPNPDHVSSVPHGQGHAMFGITAAALAIVEPAAAVAAGWLAWNLTQQRRRRHG